MAQRRAAERDRGAAGKPIRLKTEVVAVSQRGSTVARQ
jgi:hypothetical protein